MTFIPCSNIHTHTHTHTHTSTCTHLSTSSRINRPETHAATCLHPSAAVPCWPATCTLATFTLAKTKLLLTALSSWFTTSLRLTWSQNAGSQTTPHQLHSRAAVRPRLLSRCLYAQGCAGSESEGHAVGRETHEFQDHQGSTACWCCKRCAHTHTHTHTHRHAHQINTLCFVWADAYMILCGACMQAHKHLHTHTWQHVHIHTNNCLEWHKKMFMTAVQKCRQTQHKHDPGPLSEASRDFASFIQAN